MADKPAGYDRFEAALRVVAKVPKETVDKIMAAQKRRRMKKRAKKK